MMAVIIRLDSDETVRIETTSKGQDARILSVSRSTDRNRKSITWSSVIIGPLRP